MIANEQCVLCLMQRKIAQAEMIEDKQTRMEFVCEALRIVADYADKLPAPCISSKLDVLNEKYFGRNNMFAEVKEKYNKLMLGKYDEIRSRIDNAADPLRAALLTARCGNYIDFGAVHSVNDEQLEKILADAVSEQLDENVYQSLQNDLERARDLLYIVDNCGEIVLDMILIERLRMDYPFLRITALVRGKPTLNDATVTDALSIALDSYADIVPNGSGIPGTWLDDISDDATALLLEADVIISKGQANYETLSGCGLNIYYLLMCKCKRFEKLFGVPMLSGLFVHECMQSDK